MRKEDFYLALIFIAFSTVVLLKIKAEPNDFTTPDADFYLEVSKNIYEGKGAVTPNPFNYPFKSSDPVQAFTLWPLGYPSLILITKTITGASILMSSKIVNLCCFACLLLLLRSFDKKNAWFLALSLFTYSTTSIFAYTWTEGPFIVCIVAYLLALQKLCSDKSLFIHALFVGLSLSFLFLLRYAGSIVILFHALLFIYKYYKKQLSTRQIQLFIISLAISSIIVGSYMLRNYLLDGSFFGIRNEKGDETFLHFLFMSIRGLLMELMLVRHYFFRIGENTFLFLITSAIQTSFLFYLIYIKKKFNISFQGDKSIIQTVLFLASFYILFMFILRSGMDIEDLTFRFFAPATSILLLLLFYLISSNETYFQKVKIPITSFMIFSLIMNLPKQYLLSYLTNLFH